MWTCGFGSNDSGGAGLFANNIRGGRGVRNRHLVNMRHDAR